MLSSSLFLTAQTASKEVFMKTLAFFCALEKHGCAFEDVQDFHTVTHGNESNVDSDDNNVMASVES